MQRLSTFGGPMPKMPSTSSTMIVEPTLGYDVSQPSMDLQPGQTPLSDNYILREGALEPRPMLVSTGTPAIAGPILGCWASEDVNGVGYPVISNQSRVAWFNGTAWSVASYVSAGGVDDPPSTTSVAYWDMAQVYAPIPDQNIVIMAAPSAQSMYCWASGATVFSTLTEAPIAMHVATFDNYVLAFNTQDGAGNKFVQRVQWSDRGDPFSWTPKASSLAGNQDLLDMVGAGMHLIGNENRLILFSTDEIWQGFTGQFPNTFVFQPFDRTQGCPFHRTITITQTGVFFLGGDFRVYYLAETGGPAQLVGEPVHRAIRETIDTPERSFGVYDPITNHYQLHYCVKGGTGRPQKALYLNLTTGKWAPQSFDKTGGALALTTGFVTTVAASTGTTWSQASTAGFKWNTVTGAWADMQAIANSIPVVYAAASTGTIGQFSSTATNDLGADVECFWRSSSLMGSQPQVQKTIREFRVDYQTTSNSSLTVLWSRNQGASYDAGTGLSLLASSGESQAIQYPYVAARYPSFKVSQQGSRARAERFWIEYTIGGR